MTVKRQLLAVALTLIGSLGLGAPAFGMASHAGWPAITGVRLMNKLDQSRPLDARPGQDPFDGTDPTYSCGGTDHGGTGCFHSSWWTCSGGGPSPAIPDLAAGFNIPAVAADACTSGTLSVVMPADIGHNELLGGHGNNTIHAGPSGDVLWGDYKPSGDPLNQVDYLYGGAGNDFIYAAHGTNHIWTGGGVDVVHAHFGGGEIHCQSPTVSVYVSHPSLKRYKLFGCRHVSF